MKFIAIVGTNASQSYNRKLLQFMSTHFATKASIEVVEIKDIPLFCEDYAQTPPSVLALAEKIEAADGVIFGTPEYDHDIPAALKSVIEWLSWKVHPLTRRPVMIVGASLGKLGTVQAQESLRRILDSPGLGSFVLPGFQFLLGQAENAFAENGELLDQRTVAWLEQCFDGFMRYTSALEALKSTPAKKPLKTPTPTKRLLPAEDPVLKVLDNLDNVTGASESDEQSFEEANGISFVLREELNETPQAVTSASKTQTTKKPALIYTEDALSSASQTEEIIEKVPDTTTGASEG
ncbi:NADPH-dependent FMN reductase [Ligilactobacillus faecis]|uniref:NADPH-dependent FMN reductase n=1 Tax=Ligilactobacillus faecis TaxID=762833 RepID=UPI002469A962|nr:NADPH-dependent FMN reductase [Ligilactobacillus faecis]WGN90182.1 NAD(P)H-dependent oxidoreductase [Ligilactobacillus faecis]